MSLGFTVLCGFVKWWFGYFGACLRVCCGLCLVVVGVHLYLGFDFDVSVLLSFILVFAIVLDLWLVIMFGLGLLTILNFLCLDWDLDGCLTTLV